MESRSAICCVVSPRAASRNTPASRRVMPPGSVERLHIWAPGVEVEDLRNRLPSGAVGAGIPIRSAEPMSDLLRQHVRYAARGLTRSPIFVLVAVLSVAIGSGATTAIVTLFDTMLLRPPPGVGHAERLVTVGLS